MKAKKILALILVLAMLALPGAAFALNVSAAGDEAKKAENGDFAAVSEGFADDLKALGLFLGTDSGYELDRAPTRDEAATMLVRLLGKGAQAIEKNSAHPFTDVPGWADPYVGYLYENGLTKGIGDDLFGSKDLCNAQMFCTFVLRALGYADTGEAADFTYAGAVDFAAKAGLVGEELLAYSALEFTRAGCVCIMRAALLTNLNGAQLTLLAKLAADGAVSQEAAGAFLEKAGGDEAKEEDTTDESKEDEKEKEDESEDAQKEGESSAEEEAEAAKDLTQEEIEAFIQVLAAGFLSGSLESNVGLPGLLELTSFISTDSIQKAVKETKDDGILWTISVKNETVEAIICVFFDSDGNFTELFAGGVRLDVKDGVLEIQIKRK